LSGSLDLPHRTALHRFRCIFSRGAQWRM
jgi:hypothetical protein